MPSSQRFETYATNAITYYDITLAILYMGDRHYQEDSPNNIQRHEFILVAIDYFTKWVEAASYEILNSKKVA